MGSFTPSVSTLLKIVLSPIIVLFGDTSPDATPHSQRKALTRNLSITFIVLFLCSVFGTLNAAKSIEESINTSHARLESLKAFGFDNLSDLEQHRYLAHTQAYNDYITKFPNKWVAKARKLTPKKLPQVTESNFKVLVVR